jgi:hypothetical protein
MFHSFRLSLGLTAFLLISAGCQYLPDQTDEPTDVDLQRNWQVSLVAADSLPDSIPPSPTFLSLIKLPGTLDDIGLGPRQSFDTSLSVATLAHFSRERRFVGRAWYQLAINIPDQWKGRRAELSLERVLWRSQLWVNGEKIGEQNSLSTPHRYVIDRLDTLRRGLHVLTLLVDNRDQIPYLHAREPRFPVPSQTLTDAYTEHAQVKWNGILGNIDLRIVPDTGLTNLMVFPEPAQQRLRIQAAPRNLSPGQAWQAEVIDLGGDSLLYQARLQPDSGQAIFALPDSLSPWHLTTPRQYKLRVWPVDRPQQSDSVVFGYREIAVQQGQLHLNQQPVFLRGVADRGLFPRTGRPAMELTQWRKRLALVKSYGFNLVHFPSWCPPEAAFAAADSLGMFLEVALPASRDSLHEDSAALAYLLAEGERIRQAYGNHPSFLRLSLGKFRPADTLLSDLINDGRFVLNDDSLVLTEVGGYAMYPPVASAHRYRGTLLPINLTAIGQDLEDKGRLDQAPAMHRASGQWATRLLQQDIQRVMTSPGAAGFMVPHFRDYPGRGGHWAGLVEADGQAKAMISAEAFAGVNTDLVVWPELQSDPISTGEDSLRFALHLHNYRQPFDSLVLRWKLTNHEGLAVDYGDLKLDSLDLGVNQAVATLAIGVDVLVNPTDLHLSLALGQGPFRTAWEGWTLPPDEAQTTQPDVLITRSRQQALEAFAAGQAVLWQMDRQASLEGPVSFLPLQGSPLFEPPSGPTLGLLVDSAHQALAGFPSASHTTGLWRPLLENTHSLVLDSLTNDSLSYRSLVSVIDHFTRHRRLSLIAEVTGGPGRMLVTSLDLSGNLRNLPVAQALRQSLLQYLEKAESGQAQP